MECCFDKARLTVRAAAASVAIVMTVIAPRVAAQDIRTQALEQSIKQLEASLQAVRNELNQLKSESARDAQKLMKMEEKSASIEKRQAQESQKVAKIEEVGTLGEKRANNKNVRAIKAMYRLIF